MSDSASLGKGYSVPSRDGRCGLLAVEFDGPFGIPRRDAVGVGIRLRAVEHKRPIRAVVVFSDTYSHAYVAEKLGQPGLAHSNFEMECGLVRIGETLDERGWSLLEEVKQERLEIPCYSHDFERWFERQPASEEDAVEYLRAKVYWGWRYDQPTAAVAAADLIRLGLSWHTLDRMAQLGDGVYWKRDRGSNSFEAEPAALRAYHGRIVGRFVNEASLDALLAAPRYRGPQEHWQKAQAFMSAGARDFANAAKEAICAVEGTARLVMHDASATLGELLKRIKNEANVNRAIIRSIEGLWAYTSSEPGIRHGAASDHDVTFEDAQYVLGSAEAAIKFLLSIDH
jgi:hypothetical protein